MKFYVTTAIDYVNGPPHIGHALEKIQADVLARFRRAKGDSVFFLTGTDEHGAKIMRAAKEKGVPVAQFTDGMSDRFRAMKGALNLSWDDFIRTSDEQKHWPGAELMWKKLSASGDIYKKSYKGLYCVGHEAFITQKDLVDGKCADHKTVPEVVEEENYFFRLSKHSKTIGEKIRSGELGIFPEGRRNEILSLIDHPGLEDVSFSRPRKDIPWGVPVPGDDTQTMYVWCDALVNYISEFGFGKNEEWKKWWPADVQVVGKDILRFHAAIWPGMLLSAGIALPKRLFVHGFITADGQKMSKTVGNVVDPFELVKKYGTDAVRYYLLREIPSGSDGDFSAKKFEALYNADLANGIGNFAARVLAMGNGMGDLDGGTVPDKAITAKIAATKSAVEAKMQDFQFHEALASIWELMSFGDEYVNSSAPWKIADPAKKKQAVFDLVVLLDNIGALVAPFLPETAAKITANIVWEGKNLTTKKGGVLFPRLQ